MSLKIEMAGVTDTGLQREHNEDSLFVLPSHGIALVSDGMGGHQAGEVASRIAIDTMSERLVEFVDSLSDAQGDELDGEGDALARELAASIEAANEQVLAVALERPECYGMGATVVAACFYDGRFVVAHLGDSRMYRLRDGQFAPLTEDHSLVQEFVRHGVLSAEEARASLNKNLITRALGVHEQTQPDILHGELEDGDLFVLCSDGLSDVVPEELVIELLDDGAGDLEDTARELIDAANANGGPDNITVILVRASHAG